MAQSFGKTGSETDFFLKLEVLEVSQIEWYQNQAAVDGAPTYVLEVSQIEWYQNYGIRRKMMSDVLEVSQIEWYQNKL